ncbi:MAG: hypothetical protein ACRDZU_05665 [Acidimicrobiales bacterium]
MTRVKAGLFSLTPPAPSDDDGTYLRWHLLDHMPEQFQLPGIQHALRYTADAKLVAARIAGEGPLADAANLVHYLVGDPVEQTQADFMELGPRLRELGRFPQARPSLQVRLLELMRWYAAPRVLVSSEVLPWRPHRGVVLIIEEPVGDDVAEWSQWLHAQHHPQLLEVPGVAGVWMHGTTATWTLHPRLQGGAQYATVVYLDADVLATTAALTLVVEERWQSDAVRPLFAGPLRSMIQWEAWPA